MELDRTKVLLGVIVCIIAGLVCSLGLFLRDTQDSQYWPLLISVILAYWLIGSSLSLRSLKRSNWQKTDLFLIISTILLAVSFGIKLSLTNSGNQNAFVVADFVFNMMTGGFIIYNISVSLLTQKYKTY